MEVFLGNQVRFELTSKRHICRLVFFGMLAVAAGPGYWTPAADNERRFDTIRSPSQLAAFP